MDAYVSDELKRANQQVATWRGKMEQAEDENGRAYASDWLSYWHGWAAGLSGVAGCGRANNNPVMVSAVKMAILVTAVLLVLFAMMVTADSVTLFEDGSATLAGRNLGCIVRAWGCS